MLTRCIISIRDLRVLRGALCLAFVTLAAALLGGCAVFAPRPAAPVRPPHVIIIGIDGLKPDDIDAAKTPHLFRMTHDGSFTWNMTAYTRENRFDVYAQALTGLPPTALQGRQSYAARSIFARCRAAGLPALCITRGPELARLDRDAVQIQQAAPESDNPASLGEYAALQFLRARPACLFVEIARASDSVEEADAGLGSLVGAVTRAGLGDRTTFIVVSGSGPSLAWIIRGPGVRTGHQLGDTVSAVDTFATAAELLHVSRGGVLAKPVTGAFFAWSRQPLSEGEKQIPRSIVRGQLLKPNNAPLRDASILLVRDEPPDGVHEHWVQANHFGEFRLDNLPAGRYDYVFLFDNVRRPLDQSLLVARNVEFDPGDNSDLRFHYIRPHGLDARAPRAPLAERPAAFLDKTLAANLVRDCRAAKAIWPGPDPATPPVLAADVLTGTRSHTTVIREWLLNAAGKLQASFADKAPDLSARASAEADAESISRTIDLAVAYNLNQASGLLNDTEVLKVDTALGAAAESIARAVKLDEAVQADAAVALLLTAAALDSSPLAPEWHKRSRELFTARLNAVAQAAEQNPAAINHAGLCSLLEYAIADNAIEGLARRDWQKIERIVDLAAAMLTPEQRRVLPEQQKNAPEPGLAFLGLAKTAFADKPFGGEMRTLWQLCGSPYWAPHGTESILGTLLTAAAFPPARPAEKAQSRKLTDTSAVLRLNWGTPEEWFVYVNDWDVYGDMSDVWLPRSPTLFEAKIDAPDGQGNGVIPVPRSGEETLGPPPSTIRRFVSSSACDYLLLTGTLKIEKDMYLGQETVLGQAYRHVLFNKVTGYVVLADELPGCIIRVMRLGSRIVTKRGADADIAASESHSFRPGPTEKNEASAANHPIHMTYVAPAGAARGRAQLAAWDATVTPLTQPDDKTPPDPGVQLQFTSDRGTEFIRLARTPAHVESNVSDDLLDGAVGLIRRGPKSTDIMLIDASWAQSAEHYLRLSAGTGYATFYGSDRAEGWSSGPRREVTISLGKKAPQGLTLTIDGRPARLFSASGRLTFDLPAGSHSFEIK